MGCNKWSSPYPGRPAVASRTMLPLAADYWAVTGSVSGAVAAGLAILALGITVKYAREAGAETRTLIDSLRSLVRETEAQGRVQERLLSEQRASRTIDLLRDVSRQLAEVRGSAERVKQGYPPNLLSADQYRLEALTIALTGDPTLPICERVVASPSADEVMTLLPQAQREVEIALKDAAGSLTLAMQATGTAVSRGSGELTVAAQEGPAQKA